MSDQPPAPPPDTKDWTWVLERPCPECGFEAARVEPSDVAGMLRANAQEWVALLGQPQEQVRRRPAPATWSALEYGCHVRDVFRLYRERLHLMLTQDGPTYPNWDQDATAVAARYDLQDPATVADELVAAAHALADRFEDVQGADWERTGFRSDGAAFTIAGFARYLVHDPIHHVADVRAGYAAADPADGA